MELPEYNEQEFDEQPFTCPNCRWKGKGYETVVIDFFGVVSSQEVHCPNCDEKLAILKKESGAGDSASDRNFQTS